MNFRKLSLRTRIFISMILLILATFIVIAFMTIYQYNEQTVNYNQRRFARKENATRLSIKYELDNTLHPLKTEELFDYFKNPIQRITKIHKVNVNFYDLEGKLLLDSKAILANDSIYESDEYLKAYELNKLKNQDRFVERKRIDEDEFSQSSYSYLHNKSGDLIGFLRLHYIQNNKAQDKNLKEFLQRLSIVYLLMFFLAIFVAFLLSQYIASSLSSIVRKIEEIGKSDLSNQNPKIELDNPSREIRKLVSAYNNMVDELASAAKKLAASEREQAWREMAKQVAHEIKNPLTPMRLTVQSFERKFDPSDPEIKGKLKEYSESMIQQIDVMSSIASAFSDFAKMPKQRLEQVEVIGVIKSALDIFENGYISFETNTKESWLLVDKTQIIRVVTNLVKNAIEAVESIETPKISIEIEDNQLLFKLSVSDNGKGIDAETQALIFEPRFTTKSGGTGLGLAMSKKIMENYNGQIYFSTVTDVGTKFTIEIPKK